ncbi:MAG: hypothetical protein ABEK59_02965 [Halobacteria archaeon]
MSVSGVCYVCGDPANHTCSACGQLVCGRHYSTSGECVECEGLDVFSD